MTPRPLALLLVIACASSESPRAYPGPPRPISEIAVASGTERHTSRLRSRVLAPHPLPFTPAWGDAWPCALGASGEPDRLECRPGDPRNAYPPLPSR